MISLTNIHLTAFSKDFLITHQIARKNGRDRKENVNKHKDLIKYGVKILD